MARMTSRDMMGTFAGRTSAITGTHTPPPPDGRTGPLPEGSGKHDFYADMDGDMDRDIHAASTGRKMLPGGAGETDGTSLEATSHPGRVPAGMHPIADKGKY